MSEVTTPIVFTIFSIRTLSVFLETLGNLAISGTEEWTLRRCLPIFATDFHKKKTMHVSLRSLFYSFGTQLVLSTSHLHQEKGSKNIKLTFIFAKFTMNGCQRNLLFKKKTRKTKRKSFTNNKFKHNKASIMSIPIVESGSYPYLLWNQVPCVQHLVPLNSLTGSVIKK